MVEVVTAVVIEGGRILLTQRRPDQSFQWTWESPGGKVDDGEGHREALARELSEEVGVGLAPELLAVVWSGEFSLDSPNLREDRREVRLTMYSCRVRGRPVGLEGQGIGWFTAAEMTKLALAPANGCACGDILLLDAWGRP